MPDLSSQAKRLLERQIVSVWQLDLLLLVKNSTRPISIQELSRSLYIEARVIEPILNQFVNSELLQQEQDRYVYAPDDKVGPLISEIETMYRERRTALINLIYSPPLQSFADAFKFRTDAEGET